MRGWTVKARTSLPSSIRNRPSPRPTIALVNGECQHIRGIFECCFNTISVMSVEIDIGDAGDAAIKESQNRQNRIIEIAEATGMIAASVMRSTSRIVDNSLLP